MRWTSSILGELLPRACVWLDSGITPCVKTPQARERLELFFPDRPKSIAHNDLCSEIRNRKDDPFYQISTLRRFHRTKTLKRHAAVHSTVLVAWARLAAGMSRPRALALFKLIT